MSAGDFQDAVHLAADPGIMNDQDGFGARGDQALQLFFIQVQGVWAYVDEDWPSAAEHESIYGGDKGERRYDELVAGA